MCHTQKLKFFKNDVDKYMLQNTRIFIHGFPFCFSELKSLDLFLISVMLYLYDHFHQKIRQRAIVIAVTTLHLLIKDIFFLVHKVPFCYCGCAAKTVDCLMTSSCVRPVTNILIRATL